MCTRLTGTRAAARHPRQRRPWPSTCQGRRLRRPTTGPRTPCSSACGLFAVITGQQGLRIGSTCVCNDSSVGSMAQIRAGEAAGAERVSSALAAAVATQGSVAIMEKDVTVDCGYLQGRRRRQRQNDCHQHRRHPIENAAQQLGRVQQGSAN